MIFQLEQLNRGIQFEKTSQQVAGGFPSQKFVYYIYIGQSLKIGTEQCNESFRNLQHAFEGVLF
jgi:hypothetical protein